jgi:hypothetical protein
MPERAADAFLRLTGLDGKDGEGVPQIVETMLRRAEPPQAALERGSDVHLVQGVANQQGPCLGLFLSSRGRGVRAPDPVRPASTPFWLQSLLRADPDDGLRWRLPAVGARPQE